MPRALVRDVEAVWARCGRGVGAVWARSGRLVWAGRRGVGAGLCHEYPQLFAGQPIRNL